MENTKKSILEKLNKYFLSEAVPMVNKNFILVIVYSIFVNLMVVLSNLIGDFNTNVIILCLFFSFMLGASAYIAKRYDEYQQIGVIICMVECIAILPALFFVSGDVYNYVPLYFISSVIITFFIVTNNSVWFIAGFEIVYYCVIIWIGYFSPEPLYTYRTSTTSIFVKVMNFIFASMVPILIIAYQSYIYGHIKFKIEKSYDSIRNAELSKVRFLANMTHEIRTPMNAIVGMNELILKEDLSPGAREQAEIIRDASSQLLRIVNNILIYSKLDSKKWEPAMHKYDFRMLMQNVINTVSRSMQEEGSEFFVFIDRTIPKYLFGDEQSIKQIFMYLLFNSIQQKNRRSMSLEVKAERVLENHTVRLKCRIAENGPGIAEADIDSILGAYNKYDSRRNATLKGLGLEISICKELLAMMDGFLKIESVVGVGTAIVFEFSNYIIDETPMLELDENIERHILVYLHDKDEEKIWKGLMEDIAVSPVYVSGPIAFQNEVENRRYTHIFLWEQDYELLCDIFTKAMCEDITYIITDYRHVYTDFGKCRLIRKPISSINMIDILNGIWNEKDFARKGNIENVTYPDARILIVDDSLVNQKVMCGVLENFKINARTASSGRECIEILKKEEFDLIMLDQMMPDMDGIDTLQNIKQLSEEIATVPVLCITAELGRDVGDKLIEKGFEDYIAKPVKSFHLARILKKYLPEELAVLVEETNTETKQSDNDRLESVDLTSIDINKGIENVGGSKEIYNAVLNTYLNEGFDKMMCVPEQFVMGDIALFTTNVHALKSSSASIGALAISEVFKSLEAAGKQNDKEFIQNNLNMCMDAFKELLDKVKAFLVEEGAYDSATASGIEEPTGDEVKIKADIIIDLQQNLNNVNLKRCEEILDSLLTVNYGPDINHMLKDIKGNYDMFEYHKVKDGLVELLNLIEGN